MSTPRKKSAKPKLEPYHVYVEQVNQSMVVVRANSAEDASEKGYRKWRRECAHSRVSYVDKQPQ